jgi:L-2-hydroxyglutarate oxidase LhgO
MASTMIDIDVAVIGGGVTGLASAVALAERGASVCVLESAAKVGRATSTHNSGVIHAGIYYPAGSLKARLCVEGRDRLFEFCPKHNVPHARCGKFIIASTHEEAAELPTLKAKAEANGVRIMDADQAFLNKKEPNVAAVAALWSPDTGILESEALVKALEHLCRQKDVAIVVGSRVTDAAPTAHGIELVTPHERIVAGTVVNAAGLYADETSSLLHHTGAGLGVRLAKTTWGSVTLGPTIHYRDSREDYESDRLPLESFLEPARKMLPWITLADLQPGGSGIRAKLQGPGQGFADFLIERDTRNPRVIQAAGIDSPGLTSCLAIGNLVAEIWSKG